jgi:hypothetical protein
VAEHSPTPTGGTAYADARERDRLVTRTTTGGTIHGKHGEGDQ